MQEPEIFGDSWWVGFHSSILSRIHTAYKADYDNGTPLTAGTWKSTQLKRKKIIFQTFILGFNLLHFPGCGRFSNHHLKDDFKVPPNLKKKHRFLLPPMSSRRFLPALRSFVPFPISGSSTHPHSLRGPTWKLVELMAASNSWILLIELGQVLEGIYWLGTNHHTILRKVSTHLKYIR